LAERGSNEVGYVEHVLAELIVCPSDGAAGKGLALRDVER
jgi:hypothetical protein